MRIIVDLCFTSLWSLWKESWIIFPPWVICCFSLREWIKRRKEDISYLANWVLSTKTCFRSFATSNACESTLTTGLFFICLALSAYLRVYGDMWVWFEQEAITFTVSSKFVSAGLQQAIITVREFPPWLWDERGNKWHQWVLENSS